jgi:hypothetical protein
MSFIVPLPAFPFDGGEVCNAGAKNYLGILQGESARGEIVGLAGDFRFG